MRAAKGIVQDWEKSLQPNQKERGKAWFYRGIVQVFAISLQDVAITPGL
jgi:hypothetical protein